MGRLGAMLAILVFSCGVGTMAADAAKYPNILGVWSGTANVVTENAAEPYLTVDMKLEITEQNGERFRGLITLPQPLSPYAEPYLVTGVFFEGTLRITDDGYVYFGRRKTSPLRIDGYWQRVTEGDNNPYYTHTATFSLKKVKSP
jgi:hypothetical protein